MKFAFANVNICLSQLQVVNTESQLIIVRLVSFQSTACSVSADADANIFATEMTAKISCASIKVKSNSIFFAVDFDSTS